MDEREIVRRAQDGDAEAFALLVKKYQSRVFSMAMSFARDRDIADDLSQEIFFKVYTALPKFRFGSEFGTWLYRVTLNGIRDFLRKKSRLKEVSLEDIGELPASDDSEERREKERRQEYAKRLVEQEMEKLPVNYRIALTLRDIQGLSYDDIVRILGISPGTVDSRIHRGRKLLRRRLAPLLGREGGF